MFSVYIEFNKPQRLGCAVSNAAHRVDPSLRKGAPVDILFSYTFLYWRIPLDEIDKKDITGMNATRILTKTWV